MPLPTIAALWMHGPLSFLEQLCLKSFADSGHRVVLYHYGPLENVPAGVELADAHAILPQTSLLTQARAQGVTLQSDLFRYRLLAQSENTVWADTDAYCVKPFQITNGYVYGWRSQDHVGVGVLALPADSDTLRALLHHTKDEFAIPRWYGRDYEAELTARRDAGAAVHVSEQPRGVWGSHALTHFLKETGELAHALPRDAFYPISFKDRRKLLRRDVDTAGQITEATFSIHLYGRRLRARLAEQGGGVPHPRSLLGRLLARHGIDPQQAPVAAPDASPAAPVTLLRPATPPTAAPAPVQAADPLAPPRAAMAAPLPESPVRPVSAPPVSAPPRARDFNLALYRLLLRARGDDGAPEVVALGRPSDLAPLQRALAAMLPKARMRAMSHDMTAPQTLAETALDLGEPDVIIDDTSINARQKQLNFLAFFATLKPGGLYLIECLHDDANALETLALFRSFLDCGGFVHPDPAFGRDFAVMQPEIDGCFIIAGRDGKDQTIVLHRR